MKRNWKRWSWAAGIVWGASLPWMSGLSAQETPPKPAEKPAPVLEDPNRPPPPPRGPESRRPPGPGEFGPGGGPPGNPDGRPPFNPDGGGRAPRAGGFGPPPGAPGGPGGPGPGGDFGPHGRPGMSPGMPGNPAGIAMMPGGPGQGMDPEMLRRVDPEVYELQKADAEFTRREFELSAQLQQTPRDGRAALKQELQEVLAKHFDSRQKRRELELNRIQKELERMRDELKRREESREAIIKRRLMELAGERDELDF